jgi:hypothetical protein
MLQLTSEVRTADAVLEGPGRASPLGVTLLKDFHQQSEKVQLQIRGGAEVVIIPIEAMEFHFSIFRALKRPPSF